MNISRKTTLASLAAVALIGSAGLATPLIASADDDSSSRSTSSGHSEPEPGDDHGRHLEPDDDHGQRAEPGDDHGGSDGGDDD